MSTATLDRMKVSYFRTALDSGYRVDKRDNGSGIIYGVPIFRAGTFKDSMGDPHTWESEHLQQMVFHFNMLREREVLPNIPVRDQHKSLFGGGGRVVGYLEGLRVEGEDANGNPLLVADMDITEPEDFGRIERGTWRSRSAEVGFYETNDDVMYWPVLMGVAWVDLPAVEGLFGKDSGKTGEVTYTPIHDDEEAAVSHANKKANKGGAGTATPPANDGGKEGEHNAPPAKETNDGEEQSGAGEGSGEQAGDGSGDHGSSATPPAGSPVTPPAQHGAPNQPFEFTLNGGTKTTDFAAVQAHIENLESVLAESREQARKDFVKELADSHRIAATQLESMEAHALSLTDEQYESFVEMWSNAPASPLFAHHGQGTTTEPGDESASEVETLRERVKMHMRGGMSEDKVKETQSYKRLMELTDGKG